MAWVFGVSHFCFHRKRLALQKANSIWLSIVQKMRAVRLVYYYYYYYCWYVCICNYTTYLCLSSLLQNESTFFGLISFFQLPAEWSERSAFNFFPEITVSLKKKNKKSSTSLQEGYKKKKKRVVSIPYLWCSKTGSSLSREWVAGSVARL